LRKALYFAVSAGVGGLLREIGAKNYLKTKKKYPSIRFSSFDRKSRASVTGGWRCGATRLPGFEHA